MGERALLASAFREQQSPERLALHRLQPEPHRKESEGGEEMTLSSREVLQTRRVKEKNNKKTYMDYLLTCHIMY